MITCLLHTAWYPAVFVLTNLFETGRYGNFTHGGQWKTLLLDWLRKGIPNKQ